jgi:hypothetical protein
VPYTPPPAAPAAGGPQISGRPLGGRFAAGGPQGAGYPQPATSAAPAAAAPAASNRYSGLPQPGPQQQYGEQAQRPPPAAAGQAGQQGRGGAYGGYQPPAAQPQVPAEQGPFGPHASQQNQSHPGSGLVH